MTQAQALTARRSGDELHLDLAGEWRVAELSALDQALAALDLTAVRHVRLNTANLAVLDFSAAWLLREFIERVRQPGREVTFDGPEPEQLRLITDCLARVPYRPPAANDEGGIEPVEAIGRHAVRRWRDVVAAMEFLGRITVTAARALVSPRHLRPISIARHVYDTGITAIPIVTLIAFLISVIIAYMSAQQLQKFGAEIFVVDLVTIGVLRELGVLLTAIIVAGRSGSAFAAEIGAMKLNEEVDALKATGVNPFEVLVLPRVFGLVIALPLLTVISDAVGLAGGALLCRYLLDMPHHAVHRARERLHRSHHVLGGHHQGAGVCRAHRDGRRLPRHAGAGLLARARPAHYGRGRAVHLSRHSRGCAVRRAVHGARHLMAARDGNGGAPAGASPWSKPAASSTASARRWCTTTSTWQWCENEVFGIVGGSGTGKSVLLRTILGLHRPQAGIIRLEGRDITRLPDSATARGQGALWRHLPAGRAVLIAHRAAERAAADDRAREAHVRHARRARDAEGPPGRAAGRGGAEVPERSSPAAWSNAPRWPGRWRSTRSLLFLDEPTSGLDPISAAAFDELLMELQSQLKLTVVMITHDLDTIFRTCNRVGVIVDRKMETDTLEGIVQHEHPWIQAYFHGERASARGLGEADRGRGSRHGA